MEVVKSNTEGAILIILVRDYNLKQVPAVFTLLDFGLADPIKIIIEPLLDWDYVEKPR